MRNMLKRIITRIVCFLFKKDLWDITIECQAYLDIQGLVFSYDKKNGRFCVTLIDESMVRK